jgi:hypothetical protein
MSMQKFMTPTPVSEPILVAPREAARRLSVCERTLWSLTKLRQIPSLKIGKCVRYRVVDLENWAKQQVISDGVEIGD